MASLREKLQSTERLTNQLAENNVAEERRAGRLAGACRVAHGRGRRRNADHELACVARLRALDAPAEKARQTQHALDTTVTAARTDDEPFEDGIEEEDVLDEPSAASTITATTAVALAMSGDRDRHRRHADARVSR